LTRAVCERLRPVGAAIRAAHEIAAQCLRLAIEARRPALVRPPPRRPRLQRRLPARACAVLHPHVHGGSSRTSLGGTARFFSVSSATRSRAGGPPVTASPRATYQSQTALSSSRSRAIFACSSSRYSSVTQRVCVGGSAPSKLMASVADVGSSVAPAR